MPWRSAARTRPRALRPGGALAKPHRAILIAFETPLLRQIVHRSLELVKARIHQQGVQTEVDLPDRPVHLNLDPDQITSVLVNLFLNALDAMPGGGTLRIEHSTLAGNPSGGFQTSPGIFDHVDGHDTKPAVVDSTIK